MLKKTHEHEFLPAALEIQESPPSPVGRMVVWSLTLLITITIAWTCIGEVDVVATAQGKIITAGHSKTIQPLEIGVIKAIHVKEGQRVTRGDLLIELDATSSRADKQRIDEELLMVQMEKQRLIIAADYKGDEKPSTAHNKHISWWVSKLTFDLSLDKSLDKSLTGDVEQKALQRNILKSQLQEHNARLESVNAVIAQKKAEYATAKIMTKKLESTLPIITERAIALKELLSKNLAPRHSYLEIEQQRIEQQFELASLREKINEIGAAFVGAKKQKMTVQAEFTKNNMTALAEANRKIAALSQEANKAQQHFFLKKITAPVSGVVQQLEIHTIGGVVTPAQAMMVIVPENATLEVEAWVANKDIGFITEGQVAEIKIETFPFTKYGIIEGEMVTVSNDAIADEQYGLVYRATVLMKKSVIQVKDKLVNLSPGMAVTIEVKTGKRKIIEYFLSPLMEYVDESVTER